MSGTRVLLDAARIPVALFQSINLRAFSVLPVLGLLAAVLPALAEAAQCGFVHGAADSQNTCGVRADGGLQCWGAGYSELFPVVPAGRFMKVASSGAGGCALRTDGTAVCWGNISPGARQPPSGTFTDIVVEYEHACGLRPDGSARCWGSGAPAPPASTTFTQLTSGYGYTCGLKVDSTVQCWGSGPATLAPSGEFSSISGGYNEACGVRGDGVVECWGNSPASPDGQFSVAGVMHSGGCGLRPDGTVSCWSKFGFDYIPVDGHFVQIWTGVQHACALRADGTVECWGSNDSTEATPPASWQRLVLSFGNTSACGLKIDGTWKCWGNLEENPDIDEILAVSIGKDEPASNDYACGLRLDGTAYCWGGNGYAYGTAPSGQFLQVVAGGKQACGLRPDGSADCWGINTYGAASDRPGPFTQLSAGETFNCGLRTDGTIECWGLDAYDQLDAPPGTYTHVTAGRDHACAIRDDATVACWGGNGVVPLENPPAGTFATITAGGLATCGIRTDGSAACWGRNLFNEDPPAGEFANIAAALRYACGVRPNGDLVCWGNYPNATTDDCAVCGDTILESVEDCDDGNTAPDDGCSSVCVFECDGGVCDAECAEAPLFGCLAAERSRLTIRTNPDNPTRSKVKWKWSRGEATSISDISDPRIDGRYNICFYPDSTGGVRIPVPPDTGWLRREDILYSYRDKELERGSIDSLEIRTGADSKSAVVFAGEGDALPPNLLPATSYVSQLVDTGTGICWTSSFPVGTATANSFKARSPE